MGQTFFGLKSSDKAEIQKKLFTLSYYSKGAFNFDQVYNMPIHLREFHTKQLQEAIETEAKLQQQATQKPGRKPRPR